MLPNIENSNIPDKPTFIASMDTFYKRVRVRLRRHIASSRNNVPVYSLLRVKSVMHKAYVNS
jgi:hypothetical protein